MSDVTHDNHLDLLPSWVQDDLDPDRVCLAAEGKHRCTRSVDHAADGTQHTCACEHSWPTAQVVYVLMDQLTGRVTGPYLTVEPGSRQERASTAGSVRQNDVWYVCPWCEAQVVELEGGLEHFCPEPHTCRFTVPVVKLNGPIGVNKCEECGRWENERPR